MDRLSAAIFELVQDQHPAKVKSLCTRIKATAVDNYLSLCGHFTTDAANKLLEGVLTEWERLGSTNDELAGLIAGVSFGYIEERNREKVDLVWTGPDLNQFPVRRSEQVLLDVINSANDSLFIVSFVLINIPSVEGAIAEAVERGVDVRMLIESEDKENSSDFRETVARLNDVIPGIILYVWPRENREDAGVGFARVHAKCAVADKNIAFVTSANLTSAALDKNIEMGVHIVGGSIPDGICCQLTSMISSKEIIPYSVNRTSRGGKFKEYQSISLGVLAHTLKHSKSAIVQFKNEKQDIEETRVFSRCSENEDKPKANSVVVVERDGKLMVGKYTWSRQQDMNNNEEQFYLISIRGFSATQSFKLTEDEWEMFYPLAVELTQ
ncbi:phospholipase [Gammaproteobacteria bacterium 45_16_T64]|nr:phospholipase [Gammaproteobacteria bacterium 45_16_T64]